MSIREDRCEAWRTKRAAEPCRQFKRNGEATQVVLVLWLTGSGYVNVLEVCFVVTFCDSSVDGISRASIDYLIMAEGFVQSVAPLIDEVRN